MGDIQQRRQQELELIRQVARHCKTAVLTGPAAARWLGLSTFDWVTRVDLALPGNSRTWGKQYPDRIYRGGMLRPGEICTHKGVRTAVAIRAIFDSYRYYGRTEALVQLESARFQHPHLTVDTLLHKTATLPRAKGLRGFRELIAHSGDTSASALETIARDRILRAIASGQLTGVETIEFQIGFEVLDADGWPTIAWVDVLINGFIIVEADGAEKTSGAMGDAEEAVNRERHREKELQNTGAIVRRVGWKQAQSDALIALLQRCIDAHPGVRQLPTRIDATYREWCTNPEHRAG